MELKQIIKPLLAWYQAKARVLPWREEVSPYRTWISEIMLQQTRVETVIPYYTRFLKEIPTIAALAETPETRLLKLWEGLGYYSRARNLQKAAKMIQEKFGGEFPENFEDILSLPGIGEYTAGAISSIAFGKPTPAVDGNVLRVLCRLTGDRRDNADKRTQSSLREALQDIYPTEHCGDFTQSLMELGAIVCLPNGEPRCKECPLAKQCTARAEGTISEIPVKTPKKARRIERKTVLLITHGDKVAIQQRKGKGLLAGLWEFPLLDGHPDKQEILKFLADAGFQVKSLKEASKARHIFSHLEWQMKGFLVEGSGDAPSYTWATRHQVKTEFAFPTALKAFKKLL